MLGKKGFQFLVLVLAGCTAAEGDDNSTDLETSTGQASTTEAEVSPASSTSAGTTGTSDSPNPTSTAESSSTGGACADVVPVDNPEGRNCSVQDQDCPDCHKCTWDWDGDNVQPPPEGGTVCVPVHADPVASLEPCTYQGPGQDNCGENEFCWSPAPDTNDGYCIEFCGSLGACPEGTVCQGSAAYDWGCVPTCDPFEPECVDDAEECVLYSNDDGQCIHVPDTLVSSVGAECFGLCGEGLICVTADVFGPDCEFGSCCAELCDADHPCSDPELECLSECGEAPQAPSACVPPQPSDPSQCPPEDAEPNYPWCSSTAGCDEGWGGGDECIELCFCHLECDAPSDCPTPETGDPTVTCEPVIGGTS
ncbi:MAG: hypothetical protein KUG77_23655, partial [Nannocystaceae bacterium]|nr:hypothetical protein [Nannocystaceae bacterium]